MIWALYIYLALAVLIGTGLTVLFKVLPKRSIMKVHDGFIMGFAWPLFLLAAIFALLRSSKKRNRKKTRSN